MEMVSVNADKLVEEVEIKGYPSRNHIRMGLHEFREDGTTQLHTLISHHLESLLILADEVDDDARLGIINGLEMFLSNLQYI